jgi:D-alanyl-D-alanine carboxypeptidase
VKNIDTVWPIVQKKVKILPSQFALHNETNLIPSAHAASLYDTASSYIAIDFTSGNIIEQKNENKSVPIASLTKLMSAAVALDLMNQNETITISASAPKVSPTKIGVVSGQKLTLKELLEAMLMTSANDAAQAVKDGVNAKYHGDIFVRAMNEKAQSLGLTQTHFSNPQGFDGNNYSSAHDLAILTQYVLTHYPLIDQIVRKDYVFIPATDQHKQFDLYNWNGLLGVYPGAYGVKIGNTDNAGYTTIVIAKRNDKTVLSVLLGAPGILKRDLWTSSLLDDAFASADHLSPAHITSADLEAKYATWHYWN